MSETKESPEKMPEKVAFDYIKSNSFRVVHADGVWGGITPRLKIFMTIWSERPPIPQRMVQAVTEDGGVGDELRDERTVRDALSVREVEVGVTMDVGLAKAIVEWLQNKIKAAEEAIEALKEKSQ